MWSLQVFPDILSIHHLHLKGAGTPPTSPDLAVLRPLLQQWLISTPDLYTETSYPIRDWVNIVMLLLLLHININEANIQTFLGSHKKPLSRRGFTFEKSDKEKPIFWCESNSAYLGLCEGWWRETGEVGEFHWNPPSSPNLLLWQSGFMFLFY